MSELLLLNCLLPLDVPVLPGVRGLVHLDPLALGRRAVILLMVAVVVIVEVTSVCREVRLELPLVAVGQMEHVRDLHHLRLHEDAVVALPVAVDQVQLRLAGGGEADTAVLGAHEDAQLEHPVGVLGLRG